MSAPPRVAAPRTPAEASHDGTTPPGAHARRRDRNRGPRRVAAVALVVLVGAGGLAAVQEIRADDAAATAAEQRTARTAFARDVEAVRTVVADPARDGQEAATALLRHQLLLVAGEAPDPSVGDRLVAQLRTAAEELGEAARTPMPQRPTVLPVSTVDPVFDRLAGLEDRASDLATTFAKAADASDGWLVAVRDLDEAATGYAATTDDLPSGDDPDAIAGAWGAERERLDAYAAALDRAADHPASATLAEAHRPVVDGMRAVADDAIAALEDGDIDGYNALLADRLGGDDPFGVRDALTTARDAVADDAIAGPLEDVRARALGLLTDLEELRRTTPAQLAEVR